MSDGQNRTTHGWPADAGRLIAEKAIPIARSTNADKIRALVEATGQSEADALSILNNLCRLGWDLLREEDQRD